MVCGATRREVEEGEQAPPCVRCSIAEGISAPVKKVTEYRSDKKLGRDCVDLSGKKAVKSKGGSQYAMIVRDGLTRMSWKYFLRSEAKAPDKLEQWLTDIRCTASLRLLGLTMRVSEKGEGQ